ncbi:MAG TPA: hypothetical protein VKB93_04155 [Thermoanaerobaculia bacterium]|nr:hypothetical protein [Thermoanaerobaculia bacterium]
MTADWPALEERFGAAAVQFIRKLLARPGSIALTTARLAQQGGVSEAEAEQLLDAVGLFTRGTNETCGKCGKALDGYGVRDTCPHCGVSFDDVAPQQAVIYELERDPPRDVKWVLVVHGMNTRGEWQEELSWLVGGSYRHMIPVAIYKYGKIQPGVMFRGRQRSLTKKLIAKMKALSGESEQAGYGGKPDVIAHSFGTWLIAHALESDPALSIGRLILLGSIVRPDFDWRTLIDRGQVEAVLNHGGTRDEWVPFAQFLIPDSGPGAKRGFPPPVANVAATGFRHSDYFSPRDRMRSVFGEVWQPFLSWEVPPEIPNRFEGAAWTPVLAPLRWLTWLAGTSLWWAIVIGSIWVVVAGVRALIA